MICKNKVVVTGMGLINSLGMSVNTVWEKMLAGETGIAEINSLDLTGYKTRNGGEVNSDLLKEALKQNDIRPFDRTVDMAQFAATYALKDAKIITDEPQNISTIIGSAVGAAHSLYNAYIGYAEKKVRGVRPTTVPRCMANSTSSNLSVKFKLTGTNHMIVSACASSTTAIGHAFRMIRDGYADKVLCGGVDAIFEPVTFAGWNNLGVMSKNPDPKKACRPFAADRDGCVLGEGSAMLLLESLDSAKKRGVDIHAEILGYGSASDATHMTTPNTDGQVKTINAALKDANITPEEIGFINAHGTATIANDKCETASIRTVFGSLTDSITVASNKSFFGHMLGASGAAETIITIQGLKNGKVPGNLNLETPDPECKLNFAGPEPEPISSPLAMKCTFGFGGNNAVLILRKV